MRNLKIVLVMFGLAIALFSTNANALEVKAVSTEEVLKIDLIVAIETLSGSVVRTKDIVSMKKRERMKAMKILEQPQLELKSGSILYPEEIAKMYKVKRNKFRNIGRVPLEEDE